MIDKDSEDKPGADPGYEVGYGRPPQHSRFKSGQSGNPSGKRKRTKTGGDVVEEVMSQRIGVAEAGRRKRIPADLLVAKKVRNMALSGNMAAAKYLLDRRIGKANNDEYDLTKLSYDELQTLETILTKALPKDR